MVKAKTELKARHTGPKFIKCTQIRHKINAYIAACNAYVWIGYFLLSIYLSTSLTSRILHFKPGILKDTSMLGKPARSFTARSTDSTTAQDLKTNMLVFKYLWPVSGLNKQRIIKSTVESTGGLNLTTIVFWGLIFKAKFPSLFLPWGILSHLSTPLALKTISFFWDLFFRFSSHLLWSETQVDAVNLPIVSLHVHTNGGE